MSPTVAANAIAKQAEQLKQDGNFCFTKNRFGAAIDAYTEVPFPPLSSVSFLKVVGSCFSYVHNKFFLINDVI